MSADWVARAIGAVGAVAGLSSAGVSLRSYLRSGARVVVTLEQVQDQRPRLGYADAVYDEVIQISVHNKGLADAQLLKLRYEIKGRQAEADFDAAGKVLPEQIAANSTERWQMDISAVLDPLLGDAGQRAMLRVTAVLGGNRSVRSKWTVIQDSAVLPG